MDFKAGVWGAFREVYNEIKIRGCVFHWTQAIWKQIQDKGLARTYRKRKNTAKFLRELNVLTIPTSRADQHHIPRFSRPSTTRPPTSHSGTFRLH